MDIAHSRAARRDSRLCAGLGCIPALSLSELGSEILFGGVFDANEDLNQFF